MSALSPKMIELLKACAAEPQPSYLYGAATVSSLRKRGLIQALKMSRRVLGMMRTETLNQITDAGRAYLDAFERGAA